ncbi:hypothetical protein E9993_17265 [Labilibacter sediminis]|nr:hypothetical protein E9993_17265 [Labilibacter sediminis]
MSVKINTISTIKKELINLPKDELIQHCLRMAKYKKDNKELLNYLLFEADDEEGYVSEIKEDIEAAFQEINKDTFYYAKKNIRRIHRLTTKHIKHSGLKETEIELLLFFCRQMQTCGVSFKQSKVMVNLYERQVKNIEKALNALHEDIRVDYEDKLEEVYKGL